MERPWYRSARVPGFPIRFRPWTSLALALASFALVFAGAGLGIPATAQAGRRAPATTSLAGASCPSVNTPSGPPGAGTVTAVRTAAKALPAGTVLGMVSSDAAFVEAPHQENTRLGLLTLSPTPHVAFFGQTASRVVAVTRTGPHRLVAISGSHGLIAWNALGHRIWSVTLTLPPKESLIAVAPAGANVVALASIDHGEAGAAVGIDGGTGKILFRTPVLSRFWGGQNTVLCAGSTVYLAADFILVHGQVTQSGALTQDQEDALFAVSLHTGRIRWQTHVNYTLDPTGAPPRSCLASLFPVVATPKGIVVQSGRNACGGPADLPWVTRLLSATTGKVVWADPADGWPAVSNGTGLAELTRVTPKHPQYRMDLISVATGHTLHSIPLAARAVPLFATQSAFLAEVTANPPPACPSSKAEAAMPCQSDTTTEFDWSGHVVMTFPFTVLTPLSETPASGDWYAQDESQTADILSAYTVRRYFL